jgi:hypothetical protein
MATLNVTLHRKPHALTLPTDYYFISFTDAPARYAFLLNKTPRFMTKADAFRALHHYEFEFDAHGFVCSKFGIESTPIAEGPVTEVQPE